MLANLNARVTGQAGASPLLVGTGKDETHLLVVMTAERGLCGGFNSNIVRLARADAAAAGARGQDGQDPVRRPQGPDLLRRDYGRQIVERVDLKGVKQVGFANAARHRATRCWRCSRPASSTSATLYFSEFKSVIAQKPTAQQLIPAKLPEATRRTAAPQRRLRVRAGRGGDPRLICCRATSPPRSSAALLENAASEQGAA